MNDCEFTIELNPPDSDIRLIVADPYPDVEAEPIVIMHGGKRYTHLSFLCPWGCVEKDGTPKRHVHGYHEPGEPLRYGGATSHCRQPNAPRAYGLVPRKEDAA